MHVAVGLGMDCVWGSRRGQGAGCTREPAVATCGVRGSGEEPARAGRGMQVVPRKPQLLPLGLNLSQAWFPHHSPHMTGLIRCPDLGRAARPHTWGTRIWRGVGASALRRKWSARLLEVPRTGLTFHAVLSRVSLGLRSESRERGPRARRRVPPWKAVRHGA